MARARGPSSGTAKRGDRSELITHGGMRFVGTAAGLVSDPLGVTLDAALRPEEILFATQLHVRPRSGKGEAVGIVLSVLNDALAPSRSTSEPLGRGGPVGESTDRFHGLHWDTFAAGDSWTGELTWIHRHPALGVPCTTHVLLVERGDKVSLTIHVGARGGTAGVYGFVGAGQARPAFLSELSRLARITFEGRSPEHRFLDDLDVEGFVRDVLLAPGRKHPVALLAPEEPESPLLPTTYLVEPGELAKELLGLAPLYILARHPATYRLTDVLRDKRLSAYWGALRIYLPGFTRADDPMRHPLLTRDRVQDPVVRAGVLGQLGVEAGRRIPLRGGVLELRDESARRLAAETRETAASEAPAQGSSEAGAAHAGAGVWQAPAATSPGVGVEALVAPMRELFADVAAKVAELVRVNTALLDEIAALSTATAVRAANGAGVERRLGHFERMLREHIASMSENAGQRAEPLEGTTEASESASEPTDVTLVSVVQHAESEYADALLILDTAIEAAADSPYEDVHRVATYLRAMADLARRRQQGRLKVSLRDAFQEAGIDYRGGIAESTSKRQRQQYAARLPNGRMVECREHIVLGSSYDPRHCLRIYFSSRAPEEPRFVIAHVGRHFDVLTTS